MPLDRLRFRLRRSVLRAALAGVTAVASATTFAACATNPVTGRRELALVSEAQEIEMGQQGAQEVERSIGLVQDQALQDYVQRIGAALAARSQRPNLPWRFRVVDDPTPNAFALPGGFIYVTRGLLALMQNEAELASVLGHEIGHVTARHSVQQISRQQVAQLGLGVGAILSPTVAQLGDLAGTGLGLLFLKYGRDDERQADQLGFDYALALRYDVREMADVFEQLRRAGEAAGASPVPSWASTHPDPGERAQTAARRAAEATVPVSQLRDGAREFLARIDGLTYGEDPRDGYFRNGRFVHPTLRFTLALPQGWRAQNTPQAVIASSPQQDAAMQLTLAQGGSPEQAARAFLSQQGIRPGQATSVTVNGVPAVASYFEAAAEQGTITGFVAFFGHGGRTYQVLGYAPSQRFGAYDQIVRASVGSFAPLTDPALIDVQPTRLDVVTLPAPTTPAELARRYPSAPAELLALLNQAPSVTTAIPAGAAKVVVRGGA